MSVFGYAFWIFFTQYINNIKLVDCKSIVRTKKFLMEDAENSLMTFVLNPGRQLLSSRSYDFEPSDIRPYRRYTTTDNGPGTTAMVFIIIAFIISFIYVFVKCCMCLAKHMQHGESDTESNSQRILHRPPWRPNSALFNNQDGLIQQSRRSGSRPLAPPRTSPSYLILLPEERQLQALFENTENPAVVGIENPIYSTFNNQNRRDSNPTPLLDLPPDYDAVIKEKSAKEGVNVTKDKEPLPKYNNI